MSQVDNLAAPLRVAIAAGIPEISRPIEPIAAILNVGDAFARTYNQQLQCFDPAIERTDPIAALRERVASGTEAADTIKTIRLTCVRDKHFEALAGIWKHHGNAAK